MLCYSINGVRKMALDCLTKSEKHLLIETIDVVGVKYPKDFWIIQPGNQDQTFGCKCFSWLDQTIIFLIFVAIVLQCLSIMMKKNNSTYMSLLLI